MRRLLFGGLVLLLCVTALAGCSKDEPVSEEQFKALLTEEDINALLDRDVTFDTTFNDVKKSAPNTSPAGLASVDRAYAHIFNAQDAKRGLIFTLTDFDSKKAAQEKYEQVKTGTGPPSFTDMSPVLGDASVELTRGGRGVGSVVMFVVGDKNISLHTTLGAPVDPLISLDDLKKLAILVEERLP